MNKKPKNSKKDDQDNWMSIDFGTTNSRACVFYNNEIHFVKQPDFNHSEIMPSVVCFTETMQVHVG